MKCKHCQAELPKGVTVCPSCGHDNGKKPVNKKKLALILVCALLLVAVAAALVWVIAFRDKEAEPTDPTETTAATDTTTDGTSGTTLAPEETEPVQIRDNYTYQGEGTSAELQDVVAIMGGKTMNNAVLNVCYWITYYNNASTAVYSGLDTTAALEDQIYSGTMTWQQIFLQQALSNWSYYQALCLEAEANGFTLSEESQANLDGMEESLTENAQQYGFETAEAMLEADFGPGVTLEDYRTFMTIIMLGNEYYASLMDAMTVTEEEVSAYYDENAAQFAAYGTEKDDTPASIDVRHILITPEGDKEGTDENGNAVYSEEQMAQARSEAQAILDQWKAGEATEDSFAALVADNSDDPGSASNGGLYEGVTPGQMVTEFNDWCFDPARRPGDTDLVETSFGVHIMYFVDASEKTAWYSAAETALLSKRSDELLQSIIDAHPYVVTYEDIVLNKVDISSAY